MRRTYLVIIDGSSVVRAVHEDYSPKLFDSHAVEFIKPEFEEKLAGAVVIGEHLFDHAFKNIKGVTIHAQVNPSTKWKLRAAALHIPWP